jgi:cell division protein FtsL
MNPPASIAARHPARTTRRTPTQRPPRRISGPSRPKRDPRASATGATAVSRPKRDPRASATGATAVARPPLAMRLGTRAMRVGDARVLDRLVRGRAWIALVAVALMGIVFMQVSLLKLNAGISRAVTAADTFDRQNSSLREEISKLDSGERIQAVAAKLGMVTPAAGDVHYLDGRGADGARAAASIKPPKPVTASAPPAATTTAPAAVTTTTPTPAAAPTATAASATTSAPATTNAAPASTASAPATNTAAPASNAAAPANSAPQNTAPGRVGANSPAAVAGGASAPAGGRG